MARPSGDGRHQVTATEFADYVEEVTGQLAQTAQDLALTHLADALQDAHAAAMLERSRHFDGAGG